MQREFVQSSQAWICHIKYELEGEKMLKNKVFEAHFIKEQQKRIHRTTQLFTFPPQEKQLWA